MTNDSASAFGMSLPDPSRIRLDRQSTIIGDLGRFCQARYAYGTLRERIN